MTHQKIHENYKEKLERILSILLHDFPEDMTFTQLFGDHLSAARLTQSVQLYMKIAKLHADLQQEADQNTDDHQLREDLIEKVKKLIKPRDNHELT